MIDFARTELEEAILDTLDKVLADATSPGWIIDGEQCTPDSGLWRSLAETAVFDADMADAGLNFLSSTLVADRLGARLKGLALIDHVVALRLLERLGGEAADLRARIVDTGALVGIIAPARQLGATASHVCATGAIADHVLHITLNGELGLATIAPRAATVAAANLGDLPVATLDPATYPITRLARDTNAAALALAERKTLVAATLGGMAREAVLLAADYAKERQVFGGPIGAFQSLAHGMASGRVQADGIELLAQEAAWSRDGDPHRFERLAGMAYAFAAESAVSATRFAMHVFGGYGVTREYPVQAYFRTAKAFCLLVGDPRLDLRRTGSELIAAGRALQGKIQVGI